MKTRGFHVRLSQSELDAMRETARTLKIGIADLIRKSVQAFALEQENLAAMSAATEGNQQ